MTGRDAMRHAKALPDTREMPSPERSALADRRARMAFHERARAASDEYHRTGVAVPVETVLDRLQAKLEAKRKHFAR